MLSNKKFYIINGIYQQLILNPHHFPNFKIKFKKYNKNTNRLTEGHYLRFQLCESDATFHVGITHAFRCLPRDSWERARETFPTVWLSLLSADEGRDNLWEKVKSFLRLQKNVSLSRCHYTENDDFT